MDVPPASTEERKVVSVLFADLVDSTALADRRDPEDVRATLRPLHQRLRVELERHGGAVEKFIGDAVMALFGAPVAREDDAERAVRAALAIRRTVAELDPSLQVRIGVATGEALVDLTADPRAGEGVAAGDIVNTGFRIAAAAPTGGILVDETTYYATRDGIAYLPREPAHAKGKAEPVPVWQVEGPRAEPAARPMPAFVGRRRELEQLREALAASRSDRSVGLVTVVGVPGIGKSRLVRELRSESEPGVTWLRGRSLPYREESAFWALAEIVKTYAGIVRDDDPDAAAEKLRAALPSTVERPEAEWLEEHLRVLVGVAARAPEGREQAFAAWRRFFEAIAAERPLVLLFEDLQWAGEGLLEFIDHVVGWSGPVPLLVVCTARPELLDRHPAWGTAYERSTILSIGPLAEAETLELMAGTAQRRLPEHAEAVVAERVEGNPLYAQEYARMLLDRQLLDEAGDLPLPESVQAVIAARMDTLPPEEKSLVHDAAVVGRTSWLGALCALSGLPRYAVEERLRALERKQFVRREPSSTLVGESEYTFHHVLVRDVAYGQIPRARRAERHSPVAEWLEAVASRREDLAEPIAHHYRSALDFGEAAGTATEELRERVRFALRNAGEHALRLNAHAAAARFFAGALDLWPADDKARPAIELLYGRALARSEHAGEEVLRGAREALVAAGNLAAAAEADAELSDLLRMQWRHEEGFEVLERAERLLADEPPSPAKALVLSKLSTALMSADRAEEATRVGFEALQMADELDLAAVRAHSLATLGFARAALGDRGGVVDLQRSIALAVEENSPEALRGYINLGTVLANLGELEDAFGYYREGLALAKRLGDARGILWFTAERIYESYWTGRWEEATAAIARNLPNPKVPPATRFDAYLVRGWMRLARGEDEYLEDSEAALEHARAAGPQYLFPALSFRARALAAAGDVEAGELVAEALSRWTSGTTSYTSFWLADLAVAACAVGRAGDLLEVVRSFAASNRWLDAADAYAGGRFDEAARCYDAIGSKPDAAYARLRAAEASSTRSETEAHLRPALAFFRGVDAAAYVREGEALLASA